MFGPLFKNPRSKFWFWQAFTLIFYSGLSYRFSGNDMVVALFFCLLFSQLVYQKNLRPVDFYSLKNPLGRLFLSRLLSWWAFEMVLFLLAMLSFTLFLFFSFSSIDPDLTLGLLPASAIMLGLLPLQLLFDYAILWRLVGIIAGFDEERFIGFYMRASIFIAGYVVLAGNHLPELFFLPLIRAPYILFLLGGDSTAVLGGDEYLWWIVGSYVAGALLIIFFRSDKLASRSNQWLVRQVIRWASNARQRDWLEQNFRMRFQFRHLRQPSIAQKAQFMARYAVSPAPSARLATWARKYLGPGELVERQKDG